MTDKPGIPFVKASACGNDFILIERTSYDGDIVGLTQAICDRNNGVGADGVEWLSRGGKAEIAAHLINNDGSYAEISGNGTRCVASYFAEQSGLANFGVETGAGVVGCVLTAQEGPRFRFRAAMGVPVVGEPFALDTGAESIVGVPVSLGNPHFVCLVDEFPADWRELSRRIQGCSARFPEGVNVEFVRILNEHEIRILIYERGAGETMSSGTGSSASASAAIHLGRVNGSVKVNAPGGSQTVTWDGAGMLELDGPAHLICRGEYRL